MTEVTDQVLREVYLALVLGCKMEILAQMASPAFRSSHRKRVTPLVLVGLACLAVVVFSRSPDTLLTAQFFAEDGNIFYQEAHEVGFLHSILVPYAGYLHLYPRLIAGLSLFVPLFFVPLLFNVAALAIQCLTAIYLCSPRMRNIGPLPLRALLALLYLGFPHVGDVWGKLTNAQWHLALLTFLILIASPAQGRLGAWFDALALVIGALTGPFCILLLPTAVLVAMSRRSSRTMTQLAVLVVGGLIQTIPLLTEGRPESASKLGASFPLFCEIVVRRILLGLLPGSSRVPEVLISSWVFCSGVLVLVLALLAWILWKGSLEIRCALLFAAMVTAASLASPLVVSTGEQWPALRSLTAIRYWFIPRLMITAAVLWVATQPVSKWARVASIATLLAILVCCVRHWQVAPWKSVHFLTYAHVFGALPVGTQLEIPIDPPGWKLLLTKKPYDRMSYETGFSDGEVTGLRDWRSRFQGVPPEESSASLTGQVMTVNGKLLGAAGTAVDPVHITVRGGVLVEGWALLNTEPELTPLDEMYAIASNYVVKGDKLPISGVYHKKNVENAVYLVFLPATVLNPGLQGITIVGYCRSEGKLHSYGRQLYIYGD